MDKKILTILVGTLCFGLGVGTGIGMMTLKDMEQKKTPIQQEQSKENPDKENEVKQPEQEPEKQPGVETPSQGQVGGEGWQANTSYSIGQLASYDNKVYKCIQAHTALEGWEPHITPALWELVK